MSEEFHLICFWFILLLIAMYGQQQVHQYINVKFIQSILYSIPWTLS